MEATRRGCCREIAIGWILIKLKQNLNVIKTINRYCEPINKTK